MNQLLKKGFWIFLMVLSLNNIGCKDKNSPGKCLDGVMSEASKNLQENEMANLIVLSYCMRNDNDIKKTIDSVRTPSK